jgi:ribosomal protein L23
MLKKITPIMSEKCRMLSEKEATYMFEVSGKTSKQEIAKAISSEFKDIKIADVRTVVRKGKTARAARGKNRYPLTITRSDRKFAYVKLSEGKLPFFEQPEDKKADKKAEKEAKKADNKEKK